MSVSEYVVMFACVFVLGAGLPGPGDACLIAAGTLAGEGKLNVWVVLITAAGGSGRIRQPRLLTQASPADPRPRRVSKDVDKRARTADGWPTTSCSFLSLTIWPAGTMTAGAGLGRESLVDAIPALRVSR